MDSRTQERVEQWDSRPFTGGYNELSTLADNEFSGAVTANDAWLFMLNGRIVGVIDGAIELFEQSTGTVYAAPHPSLPLLCSMQAKGGETRAKYYTNETPLTEVDSTLQDSSFTGYLELSEQVLSGDYYAVYYGGRRMAVAYIGNAQRLLTGSEAFERAADEVGIYEVVDVDIDVTDVPEHDSDPAMSEADQSTEPAPATDSNATADPPNDTVDSQPGTDDAEPTDAGIDSPLESDPLSEPRGSTTETASDRERDSDPSSGESVRPASASQLRDSSDLAEPADTPSDSAAPTTADSESEAVETNAATPSPDEPDADTNTDPTHNRQARSDSNTSTAHSTREEPTATDEAQSMDRKPNEDSELGSEPVESARPDSETSTDSVDAETTAVPRGTEPDQAEATGDATNETGAQTTEQPSPTTESPSESNSSSEDDDEFDARLEQEEQWRETRRIPSIDPDATERTPARSADTEDAGSRDAASRPHSSQESSRETTTQNRSSRTDSQANEQKSTARSEARTSDSETKQSSSTAETEIEYSETAAATADTETDASASGPEQQLETLRQRTAELKAQKERLEAQNTELTEERDRLQAKNQELTSTIDRLESRIDELENECERLRTADAIGADPTADGFESSVDRQLSQQEALAGTNLFVRYGSKSESTLQSAHDGDADRESVASNLQLETHTTFDAADVTVTGQPYEEFLEETMEYRFVEWLVEILLFEIRDTGHDAKLGDLYNAIPNIDRAEFQATISLADDDTEDVPDEVTFDVVLFDKMGTPLVVATLNDSREPATESMLAELEEAASAVTANYPDLGAAMVVTASYFEPGAHEVTEQATSSGLLSRNSKLSYVNVSRKQGYHLTLVESRSSGFHVNVPEL